MRELQLLLALLLLLVGCSDPGSSLDTCTAGRVVQCPCGGGEDGVQTCQATGSFGQCTCPPREDMGADDGSIAVPRDMTTEEDMRQDLATDMRQPQACPPCADFQHCDEGTGECIESPSWVEWRLNGERLFVQSGPWKGRYNALPDLALLTLGDRESFVRLSIEDLLDVEGLVLIETCGMPHEQLGMVAQLKAEEAGDWNDTTYGDYSCLGGGARRAPTWEIKLETVSRDRLVGSVELVIEGVEGEIKLQELVIRAEFDAPLVQ